MMQAAHSSPWGSVLILLLSASWLPGAEETSPSPASARDIIYEHAVVAADHPAASEAGLEILKKGGNVVDAAVATGFVLSVVRPASSGIGGGGFMVIWDAKQKRSVALDYRERAPAKATRTMFTEPAPPAKPSPDLSEHGALAIAIPCHVAGLCRALEKFGTLDRATVLAPAIRLAREGVLIDEHTLATQRETLEKFGKNPELQKRYAALFEQYLNNGKPWKLGDRFFSPQGKVLELIAKNGPNGFYRGQVAEAIVAQMQREGGLITADDLAGIGATERKPLQGKFRGWDVITMPLPSSGGIALLETLNILQALEKRYPERSLDRLEQSAPLFAHILGEAFKHAMADRAAFLGDADYVEVPIPRLTSAEYAAKLAGRIDLGKTQPPDVYGRIVVPDDGGTTHFSVLDAEGNAVACTETINTAFGSFVVEPTYGIVLNNEMDDFTARPGQPNAFGLIQSEANAVASGKRPLSSMTPTILVRDGKAEFVVGASGGPRIITATAQVLLNMARFGMLPSQAVESPRFHHQWMPNELLLERRFPAEFREKMLPYGHEIKSVAASAVVQAAGRTTQGVRGASDSRKQGRAAGF